jgi:uncharacterized protein YvpB
VSGMSSTSRSSVQRDMLTHPGGTTPAPAEAQPAELDSITIAFVTLLVVGLITIALAVYLVFTLPQQSRKTWSLGDEGDLSLRVLRAERTRDALQDEVAHLQTELEIVRQQLATMTFVQVDLASTPPPQTASTVLERPPLALILDVPVHRQRHSLSCESSAAAMAANFYGVGLSEETILAALPRHDNPHRGFRGNVDGPYGGIFDYGVYAEPIRQVLANQGLQVEHFTGGIDDIRTQIRQGKVVIAWVTYNLQPQSPTQVTTSDGQVVTLVPYEHAVLVTGYNRNGLWVNDPYGGTQTFYPAHDFVRSFSYLGNMGLVVGPPPKE